MTEDALQTERVGQFDLAVVFDDSSPEAAERWTRRAEVVAQWLIAEWQAAQGADRA